jgi:hypothetical protein
MNRADDLRAVMKHVGGRWLFVTLTVDRSAWMSPEAAYQRCNERTRKVLARIGALAFTAVELQTKTGDGWPHWHAVVRPDDQSITLEEVRAIVDRHWRVTTESVDRETGEVTRSVERIGVPQAQHVDEVRDNEGCAIYVSKYVTKVWDAVPRWMGVSRRRMRKIRMSDAFYDVLERLYRHDRQRGSRKPPSSGRKLRVRTLYQRMACSGATLNAFGVVDGKVKWVGSIPAHCDHLNDVMQMYNGRALVLGSIARCRVAVPAAEWRRARLDARFWEKRSSEKRRECMDRVVSAWVRMQSGEDDVPPDALA